MGTKITILSRAIGCQKLVSALQKHPYSKLVTITQQAFRDSLFLANSTWCFVRPRKEREVQ
jgi:hypothetical protein